MATNRQCRSGLESPSPRGGTESNDGVAVAGLLLIINVSGSLYWLAGAVLWAVTARTANAWVLIVEVVHDARHQPLDEQNEQS